MHLEGGGGEYRDFPPLGPEVVFLSLEFPKVHLELKEVLEYV